MEKNSFRQVISSVSYSYRSSTNAGGHIRQEGIP
jgi:hypothetical protein